MDRKPAFTIIELVVVVALICVIASLTLVNISFVNRFAVRSDVEQFVSTCRYLQQMAMSTNTEQKLVLNVKDNSYSFANSADHQEESSVLRQAGGDHKLSPRVQFGVGKKIVLGPPSAPTKLVTQAATYTDNIILFYPDGVIKSGVVYFSDSAGKYVYAVSSPVSSISFLRTYVYDGKWKSLNPSISPG